MKTICGKAGTGTTNELLKLFLEDTKTATFLSDELSLDVIVEKIKYLKENGVDVNDTQSKEIKTGMFVNCDFDFDYYAMIQNISSQSIYLDIHISSSFKKQFKDFCIGMEKEYGLNIVITEQLSANSNTEGIRILSYEVD